MALAHPTHAFILLCSHFTLLLFLSNSLRVGWLWAKHHISCGPSANRNSHAVPSGQGVAMPRATPGNRTRMAESRGNELTPRSECSPIVAVFVSVPTPMPVSVFVSVLNEIISVSVSVLNDCVGVGVD